MITSKRLNESGISLTETLVAMAIMAFVAMVFVSGLYVSMQGNDISDQRMTAQNLAGSELEFVKASAYQNASWSYTLPGSPPWWDTNHNSLPEGCNDYTVTVTADPLPGYDTKLQKLAAVVSYKGSQVMTIVAYRAN